MIVARVAKDRGRDRDGWNLAASDVFCTPEPIVQVWSGDACWQDSRGTLRI